MLTREQWLTAPSWARFHAVDSDGQGWWYELLPVPNESVWQATLQERYIQSKITTDAMWLESLELRPPDTIPCPFCQKTDISLRSGAMYFVQCDNVKCEATGPKRSSVDEAWSAWSAL